MGTNMPSESQFSKAFCSLSPEQQIQFLARLAFDLTVHARGTYEPGTPQLEDAARMREFNEFQHRVSSQLLSLLLHRKDRYPDDVFAQLLWACAEATEAKAALRSALDLVHAAGAKNTTSAA
jgi:hypothetical protein